MTYPHTTPQVKAAKRASDPLPKNWRRKFRRVYRGKVEHGDIVLWVNADIAEWCYGIVGMSVPASGRTERIYRPKRGGAK